MIVKVQVSLYTTHEARQCLIYDQSQRFRHQGEVSDELMSLMRGRAKAFFYADVHGREFVIGDEAPSQAW